ARHSSRPLKADTGRPVRPAATTKKSRRSLARDLCAFLARLGETYRYGLFAALDWMLPGMLARAHVVHLRAHFLSRLLAVSPLAALLACCHSFTSSRMRRR